MEECSSEFTQRAAVVASRPSVRRASSEDWAELKAVRLESLADTPEAYGSTYAAASRFSESQWRAVADARAVFLASHEGAVVGMASGGRNDAHPGTLWLFSMYVTPASRGTEAAALLVESVEGWARSEGAAALYLHVSATLARARAFYAKMGFVETGERFAMDRDASIELLTMTKSLSSPDLRVEHVDARVLHDLRRRVLRGDDPRGRSRTRATTSPRQCTWEGSAATRWS